MKRFAITAIISISSALGQAIRCPSLLNERIFPADNPWHFDISQFPVHPNSANLVASVGAATALHPDFGTVYLGAPMGIPYIAVGAGQAMVPVNYTAYGDESDPGPYPIPLNAPVEGGAASTGDRHVLAVDTANHVLYELYRAFPRAATWDAESGAKYNLGSNALRPAGWTSADAAGLAILPGLVRYDETVIRGEIDHAIRMTADVTRRAYLYPARHQAGSTADTNAPAMGQRYRLKAAFNTASYPASVQPILRAMKKHGLIVADNGGDWYFSGAPDDRWSDADLNTLKRLRGSDFEAVLSVDAQGNPIVPASIRQAFRIRPRDSRPALFLVREPVLLSGSFASLLGRRQDVFARGVAIFTGK